MRPKDAVTIVRVTSEGPLLVRGPLRLMDEEGREVHSEKVVEIVLVDGAITAVGDQFGLGREKRGKQ